MVLHTRTRVLPALLAAATVALSAFTQNAMADGAYGGGSLTMPTIYSKNRWYSVATSVPGGIPSTATITYVNYSYSYPRPTGLQVLLCNDTGDKCRDITYSGGGSVDFSSFGIKANTPVRFYAQVQGTGTMSPLYGGAASMTVNYKY